MVSIKDIAAKCNVSIATVSKSQKAHSDEREATKQYVRETAKSLGYMPNSQARALKTNKTYSLGVFFAEQAESGLTHNYFASVLEGFKAQSEKKGYDLIFIGNHIGNTHMTYLEHCKYRNVDGILIACADFSIPSICELVGGDVPVVTIDHVDKNGLTVMSDNYKGMKELVTYIYEQGHYRIAYIYGESSQVTVNRMNGFRDTMLSLGLVVREDYLLKARFHEPKATEECVKKLMALPEPPTCIITPDDFSAIGALNAAEQLGLSVPNDISIAGYDGIYLADCLRPKLTTIKQFSKLIGQKAADLLISVVEKNAEAPQEPVVIDSVLIKGASVAQI